MTKEQALQYAKYAAKKALDELEKQRSVHFELTDDIPSVFESKIGGVPYFPSGAEIPVDSNGNPLRFLMQIKCSDIQGLDCFPKQGMIQFWICADDCWGMCDKRGFRVIYYDAISDSTTTPQISAFTDMEKEFFPLKGEYGVAFLPTIEDAPKNSTEYEETFCKYFNEISGEAIKGYHYDFKIQIKFTF